MKSAYFYSEFDETDSKSIKLTEKELHHAVNVRRVDENETIYITNGKGFVAEGKIAVDTSPRQINVDKLDFYPKPNPRVTILQAVLKGERSEIAIELMSEVGVSQIIFWPAARSVAKIETKIEKLKPKWKQIAMAAIKQSRQSWLPEISYLPDLQQVKNFISNYKIVYLLDYEAETKLANQTIDEEVLFIVGPEGGLTDDEKAQFMQGGAKSINIGTSVLRGSTAGAVATALATNLR